MSKPELLIHGQYYHIYNRGNNGKILFREERNYPYFLSCMQSTSSLSPRPMPTAL